MMHWVDRGPAPKGIPRYRRRYTQRWVNWYRKGKDRKPTDAYWRKFHDVLCAAFHGLCAYCEETCKGDVDHFRPKSKHPEVVYEWTNWLFVCHDCNNAKGEK